MPAWSPSSATSACSSFIAPTRFYGHSFSRLLPFRFGTRFGQQRNLNGICKETNMKSLSKLKHPTLGALAAFVALACAMVAAPRDALAFCGFYVGKADTGLYNQASQVVMVHHDD